MFDFACFHPQRCIVEITVFPAGEVVSSDRAIQAVAAASRRTPCGNPQSPSGVVRDLRG